jgi:hypothetical protein
MLRDSFFLKDTLHANVNEKMQPNMNSIYILSMHIQIDILHNFQDFFGSDCKLYIIFLKKMIQKTPNIVHATVST